MNLKDKYQLQFKKRFEDWKFRPYCDGVEDGVSYNIAAKINQMHLTECTYLIEEIENAQNGNSFEEYFLLDYDAASDTDEIRILPPNIIIDQKITIPFEDMKLLLLEWLAFNKK